MGAGVRRRRAGRRRRDRGRLLAAPTASCGARRDASRSARAGPTTACNEWIRYHSEISLRAHDAAHRARVGADPGDRVHPRRVRRVLPALPGDDRGDRRRGRRRRSSGAPGTGFAHADRPRAPVGGPELHAARPQGARAAPACSTPSEDVRRMATVFDFWDRAARAYRFDDGTHQAWDADGVATPYRDHVAEIVDGVPPGRRRRASAHVTRLERAAHVVPVPAVVRHPVRLPGHRPVPARRRSRAAAARRSTGSAPSHFPWSARRRRPSCRTPTCSPRSCSTTSTCASPTSARR